MTLLLSRSAIAARMTPADWLEAVELGFRAAVEGRAYAPPPLAIEGEGGSFHAKGAAIRLDRLYVALKFNANFPANPDVRGLPTIQGAILLCDGESGETLAILDSAEVTLRRTAAATALAARHLARADSRTLLVCGCGEQGAAQLSALCEVLPLTRCLAWDRVAGRAEALASAARARGLDGAVVDDLASAAPGSDIVVTCTTARQPFLHASQIGPGTFVAAVGADSPGKSEIAPALTARCLVVADIAAQCAEMGDLHHALRAGAMRAENVHAELGQIVTGARSGRTNPEQITLFDSTGTALQDVAAAAILYRRAAGAGLPSMDLAA